MTIEKCPAINKECKFYSYQKDRDEEVVVTFCENPYNNNKFEGNTTKKLCLLKDKNQYPSNIYLGKIC